MSRRPGRRPASNPKRRSRAVPPMQPRTLPQALTVERLSHDGRGIARLQGKTVFVEGALTGETVRVRLLAEQSRYAEGETVEVLSASPERQLPPCQHYSQCGGCQLQHLHPDAQLQAKQQALLEQLQRTAGLVPENVAPAISSVSSGYRHRARLGVWYEKGGSVTVGFRRRRSKELTPISLCEVLVPALNQLIEPLRLWLTHLEKRGAITHIEVMADALGPALLLREIKALSTDDLDRLSRFGAEYGCRIWRQVDGAGTEGNNRTLLTVGGEASDPRLSYELPDFALTLAFHPGDFTQVNPLVNQRMVSQAVEWLAPKPGEQILDLFCGIGNFTLPLARRGARVLGLEGSRAMVERARENAHNNAHNDAHNHALNTAQNNAHSNDAESQGLDAESRGLLQAEFAVADLSRPELGRPIVEFGPVDAVLLDPPRDGAREVLSAIRQLSPSRLVYVSCNPATLARDAADLAAAGYRLQTVGVLDMFPHTAHIESMALFERR